MKLAKLFLFATVVACSGSSPTNFAGTYSVTVTNQANNCGFQNWTDGNTTAGIPITFTQDGATAQLNIQGLAGAYVALIAGSSSIQGKVEGNTFTGELLGTKTATQSTCGYTVNTKVAATLDANGVLSGTLTYTPITNGDAACGTLNTCSNNQTVSGNRTGP